MTTMGSHDAARLQSQHTDNESFLQSINEAVHHLYFSKIKARGLHPRFDVQETEEFFELFGELPGCRMEDISIHNLNGYGLEISGEIPTFHLDDEDQGKGADGAVLRDPKKDTQATVPRVPTDGAPLQKLESTTSEHDRHDQHGSQSGATKKTSTSYPKMLYHERATGKFSRHIRFPDPVDTAKVQAELKDGVLRIRVPKDFVTIALLEKEKKKINVMWDQGMLWGL